MRIEKKCWPNEFQEILDRKKKFDLRIADFDCKPGDILVLKEWNPKIKTYTGRIIEKEITFTLKTKDVEYYNQDDITKYGFIAISLK